MSKESIEKIPENVTHIRVWNPFPPNGEVGHVSLQTYTPGSGSM